MRLVQTFTCGRVSTFHGLPLHLEEGRLCVQGYRLNFITGFWVALHASIDECLDIVGLLFAENLASHIIINFQICVAFHVKSGPHHKLIKSTEF